MRKITPDTLLHNAAGSLAGRTGAVTLVLGLILLAGACGGDDRSTGNRSGRQPSAAADCPVLIDTSAWTAFVELGNAIMSGQEYSPEELAAFGELPTLALWRDSMQPDSPSAQKIGNWLEGAFWEELGRQGKQKTNTDRKMFVRSYRYSYDNRAKIDAALAEFDGPARCRLDSLARFWIDPEALPDPITVHFLPARGEIRISGGSLFVDTGVVGAGSIPQLTRQMASLLYRNYGFLPGDNPVELEGAPAVAQAFRVLMNEGVTGWIEEATAMEFDPDHPQLYKIQIIPEEFFLKAQEAIGVMNRQLGALLDSEPEMTDKGQAFALHLGGMNAYSQTGYAMAAVIVSRLGVTRLREVRNSPPEFIAAYQEAALSNPDPAPIPGDPGVDLADTVPPLQPEIFAKLHAFLVQAYGG